MKQELRKQEKQRKKQEQDRLKGGKEDSPRTETDRVDTPDNKAFPVEPKAARSDSKVPAPAEDQTDRQLAEGVEKLSVSKEKEMTKKDELVTVNSQTPTSVMPDQVKKNTEEPAAAAAIKVAEVKPGHNSAAGTGEIKPKKELSAEEQAAVKAAREAQKAAKAALKAAATQKKATAAPPVIDGRPTTPAAALSQPPNEVKGPAREDKEGKKEEIGGGAAAAEGTEIKSKAELKAERRAKQEAQRAAKNQVGNFCKIVLFIVKWQDSRHKHLSSGPNDRAIAINFHHHILHDLIDFDVNFTMKSMLIGTVPGTLVELFFCSDPHHNIHYIFSRPRIGRKRSLKFVVFSYLCPVPKPQFL